MEGGTAQPCAFVRTAYARICQATNIVNGLISVPRDLTVALLAPICWGNVPMRSRRNTRATPEKLIDQDCDRVRGRI